MSAEQRGLKRWWEKEKKVRENQSVRGNGIHLKKRERVRVDFFQNGLGLGLLGFHPFCDRLCSSVKIPGRTWNNLGEIKRTINLLRGNF